MAHLPHPGRLVLVLRDRLHDLMRNTAARLEEVVARLIGIREPVLDRVVGADPLDDLSLCLCDHKHHIPFDAKPDRTRAAELPNRGTNGRSVPREKSPAWRTLFALVPHLARVRWRVDAVGPRPASWHAGPVQPCYSPHDDPAKSFRFPPRTAVAVTRSSILEKIGIGASDQLLETVDGNDKLAASRPSSRTASMHWGTTPISRRRPGRPRPVFPLRGRLRR